MFGRIDFYTQLKYLVAFLTNSLDEPWMAICPELTKVQIVTLSGYIRYPHCGNSIFLPFLGNYQL